MKRLFKWVILCMAIGLMFQSCKNSFDDIELDTWKPVAAIPLVNSSIDIYDVINETNHPEELIIQENGQLALNYKGELFSFSPGELLDIPNQADGESVQISSGQATAIDATTDPVEVPVGLPLEFNVGSDDIRLDEVKLSSGSLNVSFTRQQDEMVSGTMVINEIIDDNSNPVEISLEGTAPVGTASVVQVDLTGYTLSPQFTPPSTHSISFTGSIVAQNNSANTAQPGDFISLDYSLEGLEFEHIIGDFGNLNVSADIDTVEIILFEGIQGGTFELEEAIVNLEVTNSFGLPVQMELGEVVSVNENTNEEVQLFLNDVFLNGQEELNSEPEVQNFLFDNGNSNLNTLFTPAPLNVIFDINATGNPSGPPPMNMPNFMTTESAIDVGIDVILPLVGFANDLFIQDTIDAEISFEAYEEIDSVQLKLITDNGYPLSVNFQAVFLDENDVALDSLFLNPTQVFDSAVTNGLGNVVSTSNEELYITLDEMRADKLSQMTQMILKATFDTYDSGNEQNIRITDAQKLDIKLGAKIYGNIEIE